MWLTTIVSFLRQWRLNGVAKVELKAMVEASLVKHELKRLDTKLSGRLDALEQQVDDVMVKYVRKTAAQESRDKKSEEKATPLKEVNSFDTIRRKRYGDNE